MAGRSLLCAPVRLSGPVATTSILLSASIHDVVGDRLELHPLGLVQEVKGRAEKVDLWELVGESCD
jgi:adenylate cyclase